MEYIFQWLSDWAPSWGLLSHAISIYVLLPSAIQDVGHTLVNKTVKRKEKKRLPLWNLNTNGGWQTSKINLINRVLNSSKWYRKEWFPETWPLCPASPFCYIPFSPDNAINAYVILIGKNNSNASYFIFKMILFFTQIEKYHNILETQVFFSYRSIYRSLKIYYFGEPY